MSSENQTVHENLPQVTFDINLGKKYSFVDFDYDAYRELITAEGGSTEDYENAKIHFTNPSISIQKGGYDPVSGIDVQLDSTHANERLAHEAKHYLDYRQGNLTKPTLIKRSRQAMKVGMSAAVFDLAAAFIPNQIGEHAAATVPYIGGLALASLILSQAAPVFDGSERRAYDMQQRYVNANIVTTHKK